MPAFPHILKQPLDLLQIFDSIHHSVHDRPDPLLPYKLYHLPELPPRAHRTPFQLNVLHNCLHGKDRLFQAGHPIIHNRSPHLQQLPSSPHYTATRTIDYVPSHSSKPPSSLWTFPLRSINQGLQRICDVFLCREDCSRHRAWCERRRGLHRRRRGGLRSYRNCCPRVDRFLIRWRVGGGGGGWGWGCRRGLMQSWISRVGRWWDGLGRWCLRVMMGLMTASSEPSTLYVDSRAYSPWYFQG